MIKSLLIGLVLLLCAIIVAMFVMGWWSKDAVAPGLYEGKLTECSDSPNCVCSDHPLPVAAAILPVTMPNKVKLTLQQDILRALRSMGATRIQWQGDYLGTEFRSPVFGFIDDFELRLDMSENLLHIRSASRMGRSDFGVNRKRVAEFQALLKQAGWP